MVYGSTSKKVSRVPRKLWVFYPRATWPAGLVLAAGVAILVSPAPALAEDSTRDLRVTVVDGDAPSDCPSATELERAVSVLRADESARVPASYRVEFELADALRSATIVPLKHPEQRRRIASEQPDCATLARAVVVTLSLLVDAQPAQPLAPTRRPARIAQARVAPPTRVFLEAEAGVALGLVAPIAPLLDARVHLTRAWLGLALGVSWVPRRDVELGPGAVGVDWRGAFSMTCFARSFGARDQVSLDFCGGLAAGWLSAQARGFAENGAETRPLLLIPAELGLSVGGGPSQIWGGALSAGLWLPLRREIFFVAGAGSAYEPPPLVGVLRARFAISL